MAFLSSVLRGTLDLVFAPACAACAAPIPTRLRERGVCPACWSRARHIPLPRCPRCWTPLPDLGTRGVAACPLCPELRVALRAVRSAFLLEGPVREIVHALKYRGWHALAPPMAARLATSVLEPALPDELDAVVPVPLTPARRRQRGYNQAALLARELARVAGLPYAGDLLEKRPRTGSQTTLHPAQRRANVAGAFRVDPDRAGPLLAKHVLLVDDVWTTGATASACADALLDGGARAVSVATFARALPELERHARRVELVAHF